MMPVDTGAQAACEAIGDAPAVPPQEFSKALLRQESALIWIITLSYIGIAFLAVWRGYLGSLPWLSVLPGVAWAAYGVSQGFYYNKAKAENTEGGIVYEAARANSYERDM